MQIKYRRAKISDIPELVKLRIDFLYESKILTKEQESVLRITNADYFCNSLNDNSLTVFIATDGDKIVATSGITFYRFMPNGTTLDGRRAYIANMYTLPEYRRQGIALKLMELQIDEAKNRGISYIWLSATDTGQKVYEKIGFEIKNDEMVLKLK